MEGDMSLSAGTLAQKPSLGKTGGREGDDSKECQRLFVVAVVCRQQERIGG